MEIKHMLIKPLHGEKTKLPKRATDGASCWDVYAHESKIVPAGGRVLIKLGFAVELSAGLELQIRPRSGLALKNGILVHLGTIDSDYRGEVGAIVFNLGETDLIVGFHDRIAQAALCPVILADLKVVDTLNETKRGEGGFGHTGTQ